MSLQEKGNQESGHFTGRLISKFQDTVNNNGDDSRMWNLAGLN